MSIVSLNDRLLQLTEQNWGASATPLVSIVCITYNHDKFISECIDGFLMQETHFPVEILIHDDASSDATAEILKSYQERYPHLIKLTLQSVNQYKLGRKNLIHTCFGAQGRYIATCEGDDFWNEKDKLAKQVAILEAMPGVSIAYHKAYKLFSNSGERTCGASDVDCSREYSQVEMISGARPTIATSSAVFRACVIERLPEWYPQCHSGDAAIWASAAKCGSAYYINEALSTYRVHDHGVYSRLLTGSEIQSYEKQFAWKQKFCWLADRYPSYFGPGFRSATSEWIWQENIDAAWLARKSHQPAASIRHLLKAFVAKPLKSILSVFYLKQLLLSVIRK